MELHSTIWRIPMEFNRNYGAPYANYLWNFSVGLLPTKFQYFDMEVCRQRQHHLRQILMSVV
jgi:hypothetical protein